MNNTEPVKPEQPVGLELNKTDVDGIPTYWAESSIPFTAALTLRVGRADETLTTGGVTHLVEHLALSRIGRRTYPYNGTVEPVFVTIHASGTPDEIVEFVAKVTEGLRDVPLDRLDTERTVLLTEARSRADGFWELLCSLRFGPTAYGLPGYAELGLRSVPGTKVSEWARTYFTRENAALWFSGPVPSGLGLHLPSGRRVLPVDPQTVQELELPTFVNESAPSGVALSFLHDRSAALSAGIGIAAERVEDKLRFEEGISYHVEGIYEPLTATRVHAVLVADCLPEHVGRVAAGVDSVMSDLAASGATAEELDRHVQRFILGMKEPIAVPGYLTRSVREELLGGRNLSNREIIDELSAVDSAGVAQALAAALSTGLLLLPEGHEPPSGRYHRYDVGHHDLVQGIEYKPAAIRLPGKPPAPRVMVGSDGMSLEDAATKETINIAFSDCVGVVVDPEGSYHFVSRTGQSIILTPHFLRRGVQLIRTLRALIPADLFVGVDETAERFMAVHELAGQKLERLWLVDNELAALPQRLEEGETLINLAEATRGMRAGLVAITDRRVMHMSKWSEKRERFFEIRIGDMDSARASRGVAGLFNRKLVLQAKGDRFVFEDITPRERTREIADYLQSRIKPSAGLSEASSAPGGEAVHNRPDARP